MHRIAALLALSALITSPVVAQTRLFCRYSGIEIADCPEREAPPVPELREADCCEHRVLVPPGGSRLVPESRGLAAPVLVVHPSPAPLPRTAPARGRVEAPPSGAGPPLFVQHRALLI